ncbi:hypothetical protein [Frondihabitans australicus]|uniref:hypothetical protein n=1 Tax=Frondihabitans australicus TaxID=386892 RepID=UPI000EB02F62|nr:hypothetical protein [Frondihabitans australicus]
MVDDFATGWSAAGREVTNATVDTVTVSMALAAEPRVRACVGKNSYDYTGLQLNAYMNSCNSAKFLGLITSGAGLATIAAVVTAATGVGAVVAGTIAGAMTVASGAVTTCTARGRGMVAHNIPPTVAVWCNNQ